MGYESDMHKDLYTNVIPRLDELERKLKLLGLDNAVKDKEDMAADHLGDDQPKMAVSSGTGSGTPPPVETPEAYKPQEEAPTDEAKTAQPEAE